MSAPRYTPGDILLVDDYSGHGDLIGNLIVDGERARYGGFSWDEVRHHFEEPHPEYWTHSALIVSKTGQLVESLQEGVRVTHIEKYVHHRTKIIHANVPDDDPRRAFAVRYAMGQVNDPYGVLSFVALAVLILTGVNLLPHLDRQPICSELVSRATESYTATGYQYASERMMPEDIDAYYEGRHETPMSYPKRWLLLAQTLWWVIRPWKHGIRS